MTTNHLQILQLIAIAVATVAIAHFISNLIIRKHKVEILQFHCECRFNHSVLYNDCLPEMVKDRLILAYQANKKSFLSMLFSRRPLKIEYWYTQEQRDAFFNQPKF